MAFAKNYPRGFGYHLPARPWRALVFAGRFGGAAVRPLPSDVNGRRVDHVLDVRGVKFLDHLDAGAAVLRDLVDVGPFHQPEADVGVAQGIGGATKPLPVALSSSSFKHGIQVVMRKLE